MVDCPICGSQLTENAWTYPVPFGCWKEGVEILEPLTLVCDDHWINPQIFPDLKLLAGSQLPKKASELLLTADQARDLEQQLAEFEGIGTRRQKILSLFLESKKGGEGVEQEIETVDVQIVGASEQVPMTRDEAQLCVGQIKGNLKTAYDQLLELVDRKGYKALGYSNVRDCLMAEFPGLAGRSRDSKYYSEVITAARVERNLRNSPKLSLPADRLPISQMVALSRLTAEQQVKIYLDAARHSLSGSSGLTADKIRQEIKRQLPNAKVPRSGRLDNPDAHQTHLSPKPLLELVVECLGEIDLDPCSEAETSENPNVPAKAHYTERTNGLENRWVGRIYGNFPYSDTEFKLLVWARHFLTQYDFGVTEAILLLPVYSDTNWWHELMQLYPLVCLVKGRLTFCKITPTSAPDSHLTSAPSSHQLRHPVHTQLRHPIHT